MAEHFYTFVNTLFKVFVFGILIWLVHEGIDRFTKDEDVSLISFKTFHEGKDNRYPTTTMCFYNPFVANTMKKYSPFINTTSYSQYLQGKLKFDEKMNKIPYDDVTISMKDYLLSISGKLENGSFIRLFDHHNKHPLHHSGKTAPYYTSFKSGLTKCFSFDIPYIENTSIWSIFVKINTSIFPNGERFRWIDYDGIDSSQGGFKVSFHYPNQRFRSNFNMKYQWPDEPKNQTLKMKRKKLGYYMQFRIHSIEVLTHRNKRTHPCNEDWLNDDPKFVKQILSNLGCAPPHLNDSKLPVCSRKEQLLQCHKILKYPTTIEMRKYHIPCREIEKLQYEYTEDYATTKNDEDGDKDWFEVRLYFPDTTFKYIEQVGTEYCNHYI